MNMSVTMHISNIEIEIEAKELKNVVCDRVFTAIDFNTDDERITIFFDGGKIETINLLIEKLYALKDVEVDPDEELGMN